MEDEERNRGPAPEDGEKAYCYLKEVGVFAGSGYKEVIWKGGPLLTTTETLNEPLK